MKTEQELEELIHKCLKELESAQEAKYDQEKAERTAALFLSVQMQLADLLHDFELKSKQARRNVEVVEAEKYFFYKNANAGSKLTEASLNHMIAKDPDVIKAEQEAALAESSLKKWGYILGTIKDGHLFYRNVAKGKNMWE